MKKFLNDPATFVKEMIEGINLANPGKYIYKPEFNILARNDIPANKVAIMQGSGSGHEPAHIMCVGKGMLDAACPGNVFAAPPMDYVYECTKLIANDAGVLHIINNYQGDRMSWDMGREMAEAEGIKIATVIVDDDVSVQNSTYTVGRRGVAGNFFVIKCCAAAAERGKNLEEVVEVGKKVNANVRSMGMALTGCIPPAKGTALFTLADDEIEIGIGIHGEPGRRRDKYRPANEIVEEMFTAIYEDLPFASGDRVAVMVNGMGGTPISELYLLYGVVAKKCGEKGLTVVRNYVGNYCTSLEMQGFSLTLLKLDDEMETYLADPAECAVHVF